MTDTLIQGGGNLDAELVLASDLHIQHAADRRARLLLDVLGRLGPGVQTFVLNGDVFDFCFGGGDYYRRKFRVVGTALEQLAARGVRVLFVEGNHEFHMGEIGWRGVEFRTDSALVLTLGDGVRIKVGHGDLLTGDPLYRAFRGFVKSTFVRHLATCMPGGWLDAYSLRHAQFSRAQDRYRTLDHGRILDAFDRWLGDGDYDHGVIGHFHVPYAERRPARAGLMLSVESWDKPNLLVYDKGRFARIALHEPGLPFATETVEPLFSVAP